MKRILIVNIYTTNPHTGMGGRHHYLAMALAQKGYEVTLVGGRNHHLMAQPFSRAKFEKSNYGYRYIALPSLKFKTAQDPRRILNWLFYTVMIPFLVFRFFGRKPNVVLYSSPSPIPFLGAEVLARLLAARLVFEIRDIWPLTLELVGGKSPRHPLLRLMQWIEDRGYRVADRVISNLEGAVDHMVERGMAAKKFAWIPNGIWPPEVENAQPLTKDILDQIPAGKFTLGYAGTLGEANALETVIAAAELLRHRPDIHFVLAGSGSKESSLKDQVKRAELDTVHFVGRVAKDQVQSVLQAVDACFISVKDLPLYRFGIAANKLYEYLYAGRPVIFAYNGGYNPVETYNAGISVQANAPQKLAMAITTIADSTQNLRDEMGANGKANAMKHHNYAQIADRLANVLFDE